MSVNKISKKEAIKYTTELLEVLTLIQKDTKLTEAFITDIFTPQEYSEIAIRWQIVKALAKGESQRSIAERLKVGLSTVTRGSRELLDKEGGFYRVIKKLGIK